MLQDQYVAIAVSVIPNPGFFMATTLNSLAPLKSSNDSESYAPVLVLFLFFGGLKDDYANGLPLPSIHIGKFPLPFCSRTESVAEKMLTNWFTFLLYKFLKVRKVAAGVGPSFGSNRLVLEYCWVMLFVMAFYVVI